MPTEKIVSVGSQSFSFYEMEDEDDVRFLLAYDEFTGGKWTII